ncbi:MAG: arylsulfatase [Verrucomicrobiota bacterium]
MIFIRSIFSIFLFVGFCAVGWAQREHPNVVVFLTDDQGWGDLSINGNTNLETPRIDSLAKDGAIFDNFYVCSVCAPTRGEFLTARYYPKTGVSGVSRGEGRLNPDETTIADVFKTAGYATGAFGKWHNGTQSPYHPNDRGFDEFYGFTSGHWGAYFSPPLDHNGETVRGDGYVVDDFTDHAIEFIEANHKKSFFCYVPYNTPHSPMFIDDEFYDKFANWTPEMTHHEPEREDLAMTRAALAMCENIDWNVGRILDAVDRLGIRDDTIVVYFSDNGPNSYRWNGGMKGRKGSIDEGGLRSPFLIRWPTKIKAGSRFEQLTSGLDLLPTLANLAQIQIETAKPIDGRSFHDVLLNDAEWPDRNVLSIWRNQVSVRNSRFRLDASGKLFDISADRGQARDVRGEHPDIAAKLESAAAEFGDEMQKHFQNNADRPFTVGYAKRTVLPARDGVAQGTIERSSKAPNNSFFKNWTSEAAAITWDIEIGESGSFEAIVHYTCAQENVGALIQLSIDDSTSTAAKVTEAFDPPFYDKSKERVAESHYFVKDFKPLSLGELQLSKGRASMRLSSPEIAGTESINVHSIELIWK